MLELLDTSDQLLLRLLADILYICVDQHIEVSCPCTERASLGAHVLAQEWKLPGCETISELLLAQCVDDNGHVVGQSKGYMV